MNRVVYWRRRLHRRDHESFARFSRLFLGPSYSITIENGGGTRPSGLGNASKSWRFNSGNACAGLSWGISDPADLRWVGARVTPQPVASFAQPLRIHQPAARSIPRSFIGGSEAGFQPVADMARRSGWSLFYIDSGHDPMITHPKELAEILLEIVSAQRL